MTVFSINVQTVSVEIEINFPDLTAIIVLSHT